MSETEIRWDRRWAIPLKEVKWGFQLKCCDCGLTHHVRIEGDELVLYPVRPKGYKYPKESRNEEG